MKTLLAVLFTGAMLASAAFPSNGDPFREERFKAKYGRYTPTEEARREALVQQARTSAKECTQHQCCGHKGIPGHDTSIGTPLPAGPNGVSNSNLTFENAWAQAKFGRSIRREEGRNDIQAATAGQVEQGRATASTGHAKCCD